MPSQHCPRCGELLSLAADLTVWSCPTCGLSFRDGVKPRPAPDPSSPPAPDPPRATAVPDPPPAKPPPARAVARPEPDQGPPAARRRPRGIPPWYWTVCLAAVVIINAHYFDRMKEAKSGGLETAVAAMGAWLSIVAYIVTRCVEGLHWRQRSE